MNKLDWFNRSDGNLSEIWWNRENQPSPPPLRATPGHLNFWKLFGSNSRPFGPKLCPTQVPNLMINRFEKTKLATVTFSIHRSSFKTWTFFKFSSTPCPSESELLTSNWNTSMFKINTCAPLGSWLDRLDTSSSNSSPQLSKVQIVHPWARTTDPCVVRREENVEASDWSAHNSDVTVQNLTELFA